MCCGGVYPYVAEIADKGDIQWYKPLQRESPGEELKFFDLPFARVQDLIGLEAYLDKYDLINDRTGSKLSDHESFEDWTLKLGDKALLCCPEDIQ